MNSSQQSETILDHPFSWLSFRFRAPPPLTTYSSEEIKMPILGGRCSPPGRAAKISHGVADNAGTGCFMRLPNEVKYLFADHLALHDISSLLRTSRELNWLLTPYLYRQAMNRRTITRRPYFLHAVDTGNHPAVKTFLEVGTSVDMRDDDHKFPTALHSCVNRADVAIVEHLLESGCDVSAANSNGETPLHIAVALWPPNEAIVMLLVNAGADLSAITKYSETILGEAARGRTASVVQILLEHGADATVAGYGKQTPLHGAALRGTAASVRILLAAGLNIDATDDCGYAPLHRAVQSGDVDNVVTLLEWGADVGAANDSGETPLHEAVSRDGCLHDINRILHHADGRGCRISGDSSCEYRGLHNSIVRELLLAGADIMATDDNGISALDIAIGFVEMDSGV
jgi:ankyrin repeat protein